MKQQYSRDCNEEAGDNWKGLELHHKSISSALKGIGTPSCLNQKEGGG